MNAVLGWVEKVKLHRVKSIVYLLIFITFIPGLSVVMTDQKIYNAQIEDQKDALLFRVNEKLYAFFDEVGEYAPILTEYPVRYLPDLENKQIEEPFASYPEFYENFSAHPEAKYFLIWDQYSKDEVLEMIEKFQNTGALEYHFAQNNIEFYEVINRDLILENPPE